MSCMNLPLPVMNQLQRLARDEALISIERHDYLPVTPDEADRFHPHKWVMDALERAYCAGRMDGKEQARKAIREALGVSS